MPDRSDHPAWDQIEASAKMRDDSASPQSRLMPPGEHEIELSKAISLKRIADALAPGSGQSICDLALEIALNGQRTNNELSRIARK